MATAATPEPGVAQMARQCLQAGDRSARSSSAFLLAGLEGLQRFLVHGLTVSSIEYSRKRFVVSTL